MVPREHRTVRSRRRDVLVQTNQVGGEGSEAGNAAASDAVNATLAEIATRSSGKFDWILFVG